MLALNFDIPYTEWDESKRLAAARNDWDVIDADPHDIDNLDLDDERIDAIMPSEREHNDYALALERMLYQRFSSSVWTLMWDERLREFVTWRPWCIVCGERRAESPTDHCNACMEKTHHD